MTFKKDLTGQLFDTGLLDIHCGLRKTNRAGFVFPRHIIDRSQRDRTKSVIAGYQNSGMERAATLRGRGRAVFHLPSIILLETEKILKCCLQTSC